MDGPSLHYYESISKGKSDLLGQFKALVLDDFKLMESNFFAAAEAGDVRRMHKELHRVVPIVSNLNYPSMQELLDLYRQTDDLGRMRELHPQLKKCLIEIYQLLEGS